MFTDVDQQRDLATQPDGLLAQQTLEGDEQAFEALAQRYSTQLFNFIYHLLEDYDIACDILQKVMLQLYLSLPTLHQEKSFKSWLFTVARNRVIDETRRKHLISLSDSEQAFEEDESGVYAIADEAQSPGEQCEYHELQQRLLLAIQTLPSHYRVIVLLRYLEQRTFSEIGRLLQMRSDTAKTYFHRSLPLLRVALHSEHVSELLPSSW